MTTDREPIETTGTLAALPPEPLLRRRSTPALGREWTTIVGVALLIGAALTLLLAPGRGTAAPVYLTMSTVSLCFAGAYVLTYRVLFAGPLLRSSSWRESLLLHVAAVTTATVLGGIPAIATVSMLTGATSTLQGLRIAGVGLAVLTAVRVLQLGYEGLKMQVREGELREERARRHALVSELAALQARTDPHFLFNSLNTVAGLIEEDPGRAVAVLTRLGGFFRHNLQASRIGAVDLGAEIRAVSAYLEIQSLRFGDRLHWQVAIPPELELAPVPPLTLQPLAENAVVHGAAREGRRTTVVVRAQSAGDRLILIVDDDGPGPGRSSHRGSASSLVELSNRLDLLYDGEASLSTGPSPQGGFRARLDLPLRGFHWPKDLR